MVVIPILQSIENEAVQKHLNYYCCRLVKNMPGKALILILSIHIEVLMQLTAINPNPSLFTDRKRWGFSTKETDKYQCQNFKTTRCKVTKI